MEISMRLYRCRVALVSLCAAALAAGLAPSAALSQGRSFHFEISNQSLSQALRNYGQISGQEIIFTEDMVAGRNPTSLKGDFTAEDALNRLLQGTGLTAKRSPSGAVMILHADQHTSSVILPDPPEAKGDSMEGKKSSSQDFRVTPVDQGAAGTKVAGGIPEIIVTAQKKSERLQDVPVPVTVIAAQALLDTNQVRLQDYYTSAPGLSLATDGFRAGIPTLAIRGITTGGYGNPTVGITIDDVPYGSSTLQGGGIYAPDIDPSDLAGVEVLRGPQGTLYGASSMGGLLKFVTVDPSTDAVSGRVQGDVNSINSGDGAGYGLRAAVNVPLTDSLAIRASGFVRRDPGYIDDVQTGQNGVNWGNAYGSRLSALWRPTDALTIKLSALYQDVLTHGSPEVDELPGLGDLQQSVLRGVGGYNKKTEAYTATLVDKFGGATLTAVSGYSINSLSGSDDYTSLLGSLTEKTYGVSGTPFIDSNKTSKFTQEIRLSMPIGQQFDWLLGGFYDHESSQWNQDVFAENPTTGQTVGVWLYGAFPTTYQEYAAFTDLTYHMTDQFDVQVGGRESHNTQTYSPTLVGPLVGGSIISPQEDSGASAFTYLVTPRFKFSQDLMAYARLASGYRAGGPNTPGPGVPPQFNPDTTKNYEVGVKGDAARHAVTFDVSLYYINWNDIQLPLTKGINSYTANGGRAKSQGIEISGEWRPFTGTTLAAWVAPSEAELTQAFPAGTTAYGISGDRLPFSTRFSGHASLNQDYPVSGRVAGSFGLAVGYIGAREGVFTSSAERQAYPAYAKVDAHNGLKFDSWSVSAYVNNLTDRRGLLSGGLGTTLPYAFNYIQPRTVGLTVAREF
jgi:iron complex outermembrane recepter protein